ncbi:MAG TPA: DUF1761 domain-containing protein [Thermoanaerobaculia bacterium]|jgi:hypothetical protein|nr:DUF1761 domain-containing protein [Thermoanaerobaculia bacterium]
MSWSKTLLGGVLGGIAMMAVDFVTHGVLLADTYRRYPEVFDQAGGGELWFTLVCILIGVMLGILFAKTRRSWAQGVTGGIAFGFLVGMAFFFRNFFDALVYEGFPYYLAWCHGTIDAVAFTAAGAVLGLMIRSE